MAVSSDDSESMDETGDGISPVGVPEISVAGVTILLD